METSSMHLPRFLIAFVIVLLACLRSASSLGTYKSNDETYFAWWKVEGDSMEVSVTAKTTGWIAFGVNRVERMILTDAVIGWVENGKQTIQCRTCFDFVPDLVNVTSPCVATGLSGFSSNGTWTTIHFTRKLETSGRFTKSIKNKGMFLVWAMGETIPETPNGPMSFHSNMGTHPVNFIKTGTEASWGMVKWAALVISLTGLTCFLSRRKWLSIRSRC